MINNNIFSLYSKGASDANKNKIKKKEGVQFHFFLTGYSFIITEKHPDNARTWNSEVFYSLMELRTICIGKKGYNCNQIQGRI